MPTPKLAAFLPTACVLACLLMTGLAVRPVTEAAQPTAGEAEQAITAAQTALNVAFSEVLLADLARASVSDLVSELNGAAATLGQARAAFNASDYATAVALAGNAETTADGVRAEAGSRRVNANLQGALEIVSIIAAVGIALLVVYLLLTRWRRYQQQRRRDLLRMEIRLPEQQEEDE